MQVEEINIVNVIKENYKGKISSKLEFGFTDGKAVHRIVEDYKESLGVETDRELFSKLRERRKQLLDEYWDSGMAKRQGLPTVKYFADKICLSPNYFGDLVKSETGKTAREHIHLKIIEMAKNVLLEPDASMKQIADMLGFQYPQHFLRFFKKEVGCTPKEYRTQNNMAV